MIKNYKFGLIEKIAFLIAIIEFVTFSGLGYIYAEKYSFDIETNLHSKIDNINELIATEEMSISSVARSSLMSDMIGEPFSEGFVIGSNGYVLVASQSKYLGKKAKNIPLISKYLLSHNQQNHFLHYTENKLISVAKITNDNNELLYTVILTIDTSNIEKTKKNIIYFSILSSLLFAFLGTIIVIILAKRFFIKRIDQSVKILQEAKDGNLNVKIAISQSDELGLIQMGINDMIETVKNLLDQYKQSVLDLQIVNKNLQSSKFRWKFAVEGSGDGLWDWNLLTNEVYFSSQWKKMLGFSEEEIENSLDEWKNLVHPDDLEQVYLDIQKHLSGEVDNYQNIHRVLSKDGTYKVILDRGLIVEKDEDGNPTRMIGTHTDLTNEKALEEAIKQEKDLISTIIDNSNAIIAIIDSDGRMFRVNKYTEEFTGYSQKEIASEPYFWARFLLPEIRDKVVDILQKAQQGEIIKSFKNSWISKEGEERIFEWSNSLVLKSNGKMDYLVTIGLDITENEKNQLRIQEQKEEFESIFKYSKDGIAIMDLEARFVNCNDAYLDMLGYTLEEIKEKTCVDLAAPEWKEKSIKALTRGLETGVLENFEKVCMTKDGRRVNINMTATLLPDKRGFLTVTKNVTALKLIEDQTRLASMGEMIGNIAHQWRQPLSVISTTSTSVLFYKEMDNLSDKFLIDGMNTINDNAQYLSKTIDDFRDFIKGDTKFETIKMIDVVNGALNIINPALRNHFINLEIDVDDTLTIYGSKNELEQALINILNNAKDIIKENEIEDGYIIIKTKPINDTSFNLLICDNGGGIPEKIIYKIFDPYFTTKHSSKGTGLGLSMVDKIIRERHQQSIKVYNDNIIYNGKEYRGACFLITFTNQNENRI